MAVGGSVRHTVSCVLYATWWSYCVLCLITVQTVIALQNVDVPQDLNHLVVHQDSGDVYVGAVNRIYRYNKDLSPGVEVNTGPQKDNPECTLDFGGDTCKHSGTTHETSDYSNVNKVLVIDYDNQQLITCGSVYQGSCEIRLLQDISSNTSYRNNLEFHIAANDETSSTVAIITPGINNENALYVGTTLNGAGVRQHVPSVSSHRLSGPKVLRYSFEDPMSGKGSFLELEDTAKGVYPITYMSAFSHSGFTYFLTVQETSISSESYFSKIVQVCQADQTFHSYVEMPLECIKDGINYNLVQSSTLVQPGNDLANYLGISTSDYILIGVFAKSELTSSSTAGTKSAVCVFKLRDIRRQFTENLQNCFNGVQTNRGEHFGGKPCVTYQGYTVPDDYCGEMDDNSILSGESALVANPLITFINEAPLTSVVVDTVDGYTVAFLGTQAGHLKKVVLKSRTESRQFADLTLDEGSPVNKDMVYSKDGEYIYVMTKNKIMKVPKQSCSDNVTCDACTGLQDPYCGWCSLENKCSIRNFCSKNNENDRWQTGSDTCIRIDRITPTEANIHHPVQVEMSVSNLPNNQDIKCVYKAGGAEVMVEAIVSSGSDIDCLTPSDSSGLRIPEKQDHLDVTLSLRAEETNVDFLSASLILYSCSERSTCSQCTVSQFPCQWCLYDNQCKDQSQRCTDSQQGILKGNQGECPVLTSSTLLLPVSVATDIDITANNLPDNVAYNCKLFKGDTEIESFQATYLDSSNIVCRKVKHVYQEAVDSIALTLKVVWENDFVVDESVIVTVYNCNNIAGDCTSCIVTPVREYNCGWCDTGGCLFREQCSNPVLSQEMCPQAVIDSVEPTTFPVDGGTVVTITGTNLGQRRQDIIAVTLVGIICDIIDYQTSRVITCVTRKKKIPESGRVMLEYMNPGSYMSAEITLQYKDPEPVAIEPSKGPQSGGTKVTIMGRSMDTGSEITVNLGGMACVIESRSDESLVCSTQLYGENLLDDKETMNDVTVEFDEAVRELTGETFDIHPDPVIESVEPLAVFESGGRIITIMGEHLNSVVNPTLYLVKESYRTNGSVCDVLSSEKLTCKLPVYQPPTSRKRRSLNATDNVSIVLVMDGVACTQNISLCYGISSTVAVFPDPDYDSFDGKKILNGETLTLTGTNLNKAATKEEVTVMIGKEKCLVDSLSVDKLLCTVPKEQPAGTSTSSLPEVVVSVGNYRKVLGKLEYNKPVANTVWFIITAVGGGVLITIIIIVIVVYKRRSASVERQNKKLQIQLDTLESNVRNECKQAFAELQTEVSDFTSDLNVIGIPFWDYKMYTFRVLFPGLKDHPVLHNTNTMNKFGGYEQGLHQFNQLLNSKQFLLIFIRTLEQQKNFSIRDKSSVASLLMIVLQDKMEYATEILKSLLNELIDKSVEKRHPKLMLRRTESVVEKLLSNWLSLSMYLYLKKHAGKTLFMLFKAIKHQTEKGPIDVFTSEAKYSLSEDRLLREKVEPKTLTLYVLTSDMKEPVVFKALDSDTITQAKEKAFDAIYMNAPHSPRPSVYDLDLEWRSGRSGHLPLQDEDVTTQVIQGWKRVNSLAHYHVPDGSTLVLVPVRNKDDMVRQVHGMITLTNSESTLPPIVTMEEGTKVWHLVKHDDNQNMPRTQKVISEIFLTRLLATKGTLQQYIDDLFMTILRADNGLPVAVKYLFDFLDSAARRHNIVDPEVVHTWKSNSLPLRFWVNIMKNPEFVFDISKSNIVDSCLSVIAQTFMDSCSTAEHKLGKDSPSNKLLFAKDIPRFRGWVSKFYKSVQDMPPISDQEMTRIMTEMSMTNITDFNVAVALQDLYKYAMQYNFELLEALDDDPSAKRLHLANRFEQVQAIIEGTPPY